MAHCIEPHTSDCFSGCGECSLWGVPVLVLVCCWGDMSSQSAVAPDLTLFEERWPGWLTTFRDSFYSYNSQIKHAKETVKFQTAMPTSDETYQVRDSSDYNECKLTHRQWNTVYGEEGSFQCRTCGITRATVIKFHNPIIHYCFSKGQMGYETKTVVECTQKNKVLVLPADQAFPNEAWILLRHVGVTIETIQCWCGHREPPSQLCSIYCVMVVIKGPNDKYSFYPATLISRNLKDGSVSLGLTHGRT